MQCRGVRAAEACSASQWLAACVLYTRMPAAVFGSCVGTGGAARRGVLGMYSPTPAPPPRSHTPPQRRTAQRTLSPHRPNLEVAVRLGGDRVDERVLVVDVARPLAAQDHRDLEAARVRGGDAHPVQDPVGRGAPQPCARALRGCVVARCVHSAQSGQSVRRDGAGFERGAVRCLRAGVCKQVCK